MGSSSSKKLKSISVRGATDLPLNIAPEVWARIVPLLNTKDVFSYVITLDFTTENDSAPQMFSLP